LQTRKVALWIAVFALSGPLCAALAAQQPLPSPQDLIRDISYNELQDRDRDSRWQYRSERVTSAQNVVREQIETNDGPVFRILAENGTPLDPAQQQREQRRLDQYVHDPAEMARVERDHEEDEARIATVLKLLPQAFLFSYQGVPAGDTVRIAFRPDPAFAPSGFEARVLHAVSGSLIANVRYKRLIEIHGTVDQRVDFGYGLLGHIEKGSSFDIHREQVSPTHWKADLVAAHIQGKLLLFKTISQDQRETRSDFRPVPVDTTPSEAEQWLRQGSTQSNRASEGIPDAMRESAHPVEARLNRAQ